MSFPNRHCSVKIQKSCEYYYEKVPPTKITESINLKIGVETWGLVTNFWLESIKINCYKPEQPSTTAVFKVSNEAGQAVCVAKGKSVGLLFGVTTEEWTDIENLCQYGEQLFYREFKDGLSKNFRCEQKIFFNFCKTNQTKDVLVAIYKRGVNTRNKDKNNVLLNVIELKKSENYVIDKYSNFLRNQFLL